jgi:hypothetical protein
MPKNGYPLRRRPPETNALTMKRKRSAAGGVHGTGESSPESMRAAEPLSAHVVRGSSRRITTMMAGSSRSTNIRVINRRIRTSQLLTVCALYIHPPNPEGGLTGRSISGSGAVPYCASPRKEPFSLGAAHSPGKSTLMEAIAVAWGFNPEGGTRNFRFGTRASHSVLHEYLRLVKGVRWAGLLPSG